MQRYFINYNSYTTEPDGGWVKYDDVLALEKARDAALCDAERLREARDDLDEARERVTASNIALEKERDELIVQNKTLWEHKGGMPSLCRDHFNPSRGEVCCNTLHGELCITMCQQEAENAALRDENERLRAEVERFLPVPTMAMIEDYIELADNAYFEGVDEYQASKKLTTDWLRRIASAQKQRNNNGKGSEK